MNDWTWPLVYAALFIESFVAGMLLVPLAVKLAYRWGFHAQPGGRHTHSLPTPTLGGLAIVWGAALTVLANLGLAFVLRGWLAARFPEVGRYLVNIPSVLGKLGAIGVGALAMWALGLVDDKKPLGPKVKLAVMVLATLPLLAAGIRIQGFLPWPWLGVVVTVLWILFLTNSFNFLDNMDGLCAGVAAVVCAAFGLISWFAGEWFMTAIYAVLAGSLLAFLWHNFHPARLFMGDNGSLFVGYTIASLSILATYYERGVQTRLPVLTPLIVLGVPIFDTVSVLWIRWRSGQPLMRGDRNHFSHRLLDLGMSAPRAAIFIYIVTGAVALGAIPLRTAGLKGSAAVVIQTALLFWIVYMIERTAKRNGNRSR
ncbi:undecaprenyl/decaprenyl-phosphate alpha-N-acetylglucosaminyl 1-phosphate transferase [Candidatus Sumerlaeota bacterium]|nr:undecaprenyl/decaprenyl-phosphate alpha-N-acetylglucosaminyl 1-phosphate transferase [Candidatus Sumerlaeota bacterium]